MVDFYCISFNNRERKEAMEGRFSRLGVTAKFFGSVTVRDPRIQVYEIPDEIKRAWAITYEQLDMINDFYLHSEKEFGIFCEDDIFIHKDIISYLPRITQDFKQLNLDILLLGYLTSYKIEEYFTDYTLKGQMEPPFKYHNYPNDLWGSHMYMVSKESAKKILDTYYNGYIDKMLLDNTLPYFSPDWTITKFGNRALIVPILGVESGVVSTTHQGQIDFHRQCFQFHYNADLFI